MCNRIILCKICILYICSVIPHFLLSCTNGAELVGLTAANATFEVYKTENVVEHIWDFGKELMNEISNSIANHGLSEIVKLDGYPCRPRISFPKNELADPLIQKTFFVQEMIKKGVLMESISISFSHGEIELKKTKIALEHAFYEFSKGIKEGDIESRLEGPTIKPVFTY